MKHGNMRSLGRALIQHAMFLQELEIRIQTLAQREEHAKTGEKTAVDKPTKEASEKISPADTLMAPEL